MTNPDHTAPITHRRGAHPYITTAARVAPFAHAELAQRAIVPAMMTVRRRARGAVAGGIAAAAAAAAAAILACSGTASASSPAASPALTVASFSAPSQSRTCAAPVAPPRHADEGATPGSAPMHLSDPQPSGPHGPGEFEPHTSDMSTHASGGTDADIIGTVSGSCINIRTDSSADSYNIINRVPVGTQLHIGCATSTGWYKTTLGFASSRYVVVNAQPPICVMSSESWDQAHGY